MNRPPISWTDTIRMKTACNVLLLLCALTTSIALADSFPKDPLSYYPQDEVLAKQDTEAGRQMLLSKLELVAQGKYPPKDSRLHFDASELIRLAGDSGDPRFSSAIKKIIDANTDKKASTIIIESFQSLQKLNEPKETFIAYASEYYPNHLVTGYALEALAADPYDPDTVRLVNKVQDDIRKGGGNHLESFVGCLVCTRKSRAI
jgi:hypothetical protein